MKRALLSKPIHPVEDYEQDMLAELDRQLARFDEPKPDKGGAWPVFIVLLVFVAVAFTAAAWALGRIVWGVVV